MNPWRRCSIGQKTALNYIELFTFFEQRKSHAKIKLYVKKSWMRTGEWTCKKNPMLTLPDPYPILSHTILKYADYGVGLLRKTAPEHFFNVACTLANDLRKISTRTRLPLNISAKNCQKINSLIWRPCRNFIRFDCWSHQQHLRNNRLA